MSGIHSNDMVPINSSTNKASKASTSTAQPREQVQPTIDLNDPIPDREVLDLNSLPLDEFPNEENIFNEMQVNEDEELVQEWLSGASDVGIEFQWTDS